MPLNSWVELVCANALYDQAGFVLLSDVYQSSTFGPWKRALAKVDKEETFHLRHGRTWLRKLCKDDSGRADVQEAVDWMFILTLEWFGLPDSLKQHSEQLDYGFKGKSNDQLRQWWMSEVVPFMEEIGIRVPAHFDAERDEYVIDCPFPAAFDEEQRSWLLEDGAISWDDVIARWRARGPMNSDYVRTLQRGYQTTSLRRANMTDSVEARLVGGAAWGRGPGDSRFGARDGADRVAAYLPASRTADLQITYTTMGCPAMEFIEEDIRSALLADPDVDVVNIEVVWDPVWTKARLRDDARVKMRSLGIAV